MLRTERELAEQDGVESDNDGNREPAGDARAPCAGEAVHDVLAVGEQEQRYEREGQSEAEDNLREHQDAEWIEAGGDDGNGGNDGDQPAQEDWELDVEETLDDDLAGHDAYGGR